MNCFQSRKCIGLDPMKRKAITAADDMPTEYRKISKQNSNYFLNVREGNKQWIIYFAYNCIYQASLIES